MKIFFSILTIFNNFSDFLTLLVTKKLMTSHITDNVSIFSLSLYWVWNNKLSAKTFWKDLTHMCTKRSSKDEFLMTLMKLRSSFLFTDISQHFGIYLVAFTLRTSIHGNRWLKIIWDLKTINLRTRYGSDISNQHSWRSGVVIYHYCTTSFLRRFKPCSRCVGDSRWWGSVVPAGNKDKRLSSVNHTTKTIHHLHHHHHPQFKIPKLI